MIALLDTVHFTGPVSCELRTQTKEVLALERHGQVHSADSPFV